MTASADFVALAIEQMAKFGAVTSRRMFGGAGLYRGPVMFALIVDDTLYLRTDREGEARFVAAGLAPFTYATRNGARTVRAFWRAPLSCLEDEDEMTRWAEAAFAAAAAAQRARKPAAKKTKPDRAKRRR